MKKLRIYFFICFLLGILFFILGLFYGDVNAGIFIIFPFIYGSGIYSVLGFLFISIATIIFFFGLFYDYQQKNRENHYNESELVNKTPIKGGGIVLIGPIPIVIGSNWKIAILLMVLAITIIIISYFYFY